MKVALCFSGNIRDLNETKNFWRDLIKQYDMDVYASFWDIESEELGDTIDNFLKILNYKCKYFLLIILIILFQITLVNKIENYFMMSIFKI